MEVVRNAGPEDNFLQKIRKVCSEKNIILVFDECTSGFRETFGGLHKKYNVEPDIAIFGKALFGAQRFGATEQPLVRQALTGSGHSNFFKIFSADTNAPYAINGLYVNYRPSGRQ